MSWGAQRAFTWCGAIFVAVFFGGMLLAGLLPPHPPSEGAGEITERWADDPELHRLGLMLCMFAAGFSGPFVAVISVHLKRIDPSGSYSNLQLIGGATGVVAILVPVFIFAAVSFRPEDRPDEIMLALNDLAWLPFVMNLPPALMQTLAVGFAVLGDRSERPVFPRWVGYYNLWTAVLFLPGGFVIFFMDGPLAWNGILAFWLAASVFGAWFLVMTAVLLKSIKEGRARQGAQPPATPEPPAPA